MHMIRPMHAEDRRQAQRLRASEQGPDAFGQALPGGGYFQGARQHLGVYLGAAIHIGKADALGAKTRPSWRQVRGHLARAETVEADEVDDEGVEAASHRR